MTTLQTTDRFSAAILHWLYHFSTQGVIVTDTQMKIIGWNQWMEINTGRSSESVMQTSLFKLYPDLEKRRLSQRYETALEGQVIILSNRFHRYLIPIEARNRPGRNAWMEQSVRIAPLMEEGQVIGTITLIDDVTERVQRERELLAKATELARSNSDLEQFAHIASHDLKEPLNKISAFSDLLQTAVQDRLQGKEVGYFGRIQNAISRMRKLIEDVLEYSRVGVSLSAGETTDPRRAIDQALTDLEIRIAETGATVTLHELPVVRAVESQLHQLFLNLFSNALKFARPGVPPEIQVSAAPTADGFAEILVTDNGIGFDQEYAEKIFLPFRRLHSRVAYEGSGIGLAVCKRIAELNGGSIRAEGQPNRGARFLIRLPLAGPTVDRRAAAREA